MVWCFSPSIPAHLRVQEKRSLGLWGSGDSVYSSVPFSKDESYQHRTIAILFWEFLTSVPPESCSVDRKIKSLADVKMALLFGPAYSGIPVRSHPCIGVPRCRQLISNNRGGWPKQVSGARCMHGGTVLPGQSTAMRQRLPRPNENGRADGIGV